MILNKYSIIIFPITWCGLGLFRGVNYYKYIYNRYDKKKPFLYTNSIIFALIGIFVYANPLFLPFTIHKELYRLEINTRNLGTDKDSNYYNDLL